MKKDGRGRKPSAGTRTQPLEPGKKDQSVSVGINQEQRKTAQWAKSGRNRTAEVLQIHNRKHVNPSAGRRM